jgi:phosphotransferase system HPr (HPr) family protein
MKREQVIITNKLGLHARAAAKLVHIASEFDARSTSAPTTKRSTRSRFSGS